MVTSHSDYCCGGENNICYCCHSSLPNASLRRLCLVGLVWVLRAGGASFSSGWRVAPPVSFSGRSQRRARTQLLVVGVSGSCCSWEVLLGCPLVPINQLLAGEVDFINCGLALLHSCAVYGGGGFSWGKSWVWSCHNPLATLVFWLLPDLPTRSSSPVSSTPFLFGTTPTNLPPSPTFTINN